jgi:hypothetical protein
MRALRHAALALTLASLLVVRPGAVATLPSADGQSWDVQDTSPWAQDSGGIATGGRAHPFNGFGYLKVLASPGAAPGYLHGFGLAQDGERFDAITPVLHEGVLVARALYAPPDTDYLRYVDSFTNAGEAVRTIRVAWGGATATRPPSS